MRIGAWRSRSRRQEGARPAGTRGFYLGLATIALATLALELVDTRLLSALTWYHLAFFAISLSLLGLTAGAVYAYLTPERFSGEQIRRQLVRFSLLFAVAAPASHLLLLVVPVPSQVRSAAAICALVIVSVATALPFVFAGVVIAVSLTRTSLPVGRIYAADLLGAGCGCLATVPLLDGCDPTSAVFVLGALGAAAAWLYADGDRGSTHRSRRVAAVLGAVFLIAGGANRAMYPRLFRIEAMKGRPLPQPLTIDLWNSHSRVTAPAPREGDPVFWGAVRPPAAVRVRQVPLRIDGGAFTVATGFSGDPASVRWLARDVTSLGFQMAGEGSETAIIGVGGGRDLLAAIASGSRHVTGIEINGLFLDLLEGRLRTLTRLAGRRDVSLIHAEGRSYLARHERR
jgi:hypothetical protein